MKKFGIVATLFAITCVLSLENIKADSYLGFSGIKLPAFSGNYTSSKTKKTTDSIQKVKSFGAVDNLSGDDRAVEAKLANIATTYVDLKTGSYVDLKYVTSSGEGWYNGNYQIQFRCKKSTLSTSTLSAMWVLDPDLYPNLVN